MPEIMVPGYVHAREPAETGEEVSPIDVLILQYSLYVEAKASNDLT